MHTGLWFVYSVKCNYLCISPLRNVFGGGEIVYNQLVTRMKKSLFICLAALIVLAVSCKKDNSNDVSKQKFGVDGVTPLPEAVDLGTVVNGETVDQVQNPVLHIVIEKE